MEWAGIQKPSNFGRKLCQSGCFNSINIENGCWEGIGYCSQSRGGE